MAVHCETAVEHLASNLSSSTAAQPDAAVQLAYVEHRSRPSDAAVPRYPQKPTSCHSLE